MSTLTHPLQHISGNDALEDHEGTVNIGGRTVTNFHFAVEGEAKTDSFF